MTWGNENMERMTTIIMNTSDDNHMWSFLALFQGFPFLGNLPITLVFHEAPAGTQKIIRECSPVPAEDSHLHRSSRIPTFQASHPRQQTFSLAFRCLVWVSGAGVVVLVG